MRVRQKFQSCVCFLTNRMNNVLYIGMTNNLLRRVYDHKQKIIEGFTERYNVSKLVHYEVFDSIEEAIVREKKLKGWLRSKKNQLVSSANPEWKDLYSEIA